MIAIFAFSQTLGARSVFSYRTDNSATVYCHREFVFHAQSFAEFCHDTCFLLDRRICYSDRTYRRVVGGAGIGNGFLQRCQRRS